MRRSLSLTLIFFFTSVATGLSTTQNTWSFARHAPFPITSPNRLIQKSSSPLTVQVRGGGGGSDVSRTKLSSAHSSSPLNTGSKCPVTGAAAVLGSIWGTGGVIYILLKAIKRVLPIALEPFHKASTTLSPFELSAYILACIGFAYVEGYKGFQKKFSPLVVKRSFTLIPGKNGTQWYHFLLAPFYSMGLMHATKKRKIVSWSVSIGVAVIVAVVRQLPYPWRSVVDAGVVTGLTWGSLSIVAIYVRTWITGKIPRDVDASLPTTNVKL